MTYGTERIAATFSRLRSQGQKGLITYITAGYPDPSRTLDILKELADSGSDLIEIGVPFSDPIADGPVIQRASHRALEMGISMENIFNTAGLFRNYTSIPILLMTYYNPVFRMGVREFVSRARDSGIDGLIVPDLPVEEDGPLRFETAHAGLSLIPLAAPTSTETRIKKIAEKADGFIYCVAVTGVTGTRKALNTDLKYFTGLVKKHTDIPLAVGFGISGPQMASEVAVHCDAVVVGSALVAAVDDGGCPLSASGRAGRLAREIKNAINKIGN
ncbi:MAG: tryptophan synthase subunit alpha [Desulfocucumaceae bacterium]